MSLTVRQFGSLARDNVQLVTGECGSVTREANTGAHISREEMQDMSRRRFQDPKPYRRGNWWVLRVWRDHFDSGQRIRKRDNVTLAPATMGERQVLKLAAEHLRPLNQGLESLGSATNFRDYVERTYIPLEMPLLAQTTQDRYLGVLENYLLPTFGQLCLRDLTSLTLQRYFSGMANWKLGQESRDKIRDVLASVLRTAAKKYGLLVTNPVDGIQLPPNKSGKRKNKPHITPEQFDELVNAMPEPYATWFMWRSTPACGSASLLDSSGMTSDSIASPLTSATAAAIGQNLKVMLRIQPLAWIAA